MNNIAWRVRRRRGWRGQYEKIARTPAIDATQLSVRMPPEKLARLDAWIAKQPRPKPSRPEAIRRLVEQALGRTFLIGAAVAGVTKPAFSNVPTPYDWTISPPRQSREGEPRGIVWAKSHRRSFPIHVEPRKLLRAEP